MKRHSFPFLLPLAACIVLSLPEQADAVSGGGHYNLPLKDCGDVSENKCFISAYFDNNKGSGSLKDWNCGTKTYSGHSGTDYTGYGIRGRAVVAAADGTVTATNDGCADNNTSTGSTCGGGYGNYVRIRNDEIGQDVVYAHMMNGSIAVSKGATVKCGTQLGKVASSGSSTGAHLHFDVRPSNSSTRFDPYQGSCNSAITQSQWKQQNAYKSLPSDDKCAPTPVDDSSMSSETVSDGTEFAPGATFTKTWTVKNTGNTTWTAGDGYSLVSTGGTKLSSVDSVSLGGESIAPGASKTWSVSMTAPSTPGNYTHNWRMAHSGTQFGAQLSAKINVVATNGASFVSETVPAGTTMPSMEMFAKTWTVKNTGNVTWNPLTGHHLANVGGNAMGASAPLLFNEGETVAPGGTKTWTAYFTAPYTPGTAKGVWQMEQAGVGTFGPELTVEIMVFKPEPEDAGSPVVVVDAGGHDAGMADAGIVVPEDAGGESPEPLDPGDNGIDLENLADGEMVALSSGCGCHSADGSFPLALFGFMAAAFAFRRRSRT